MTTIPLLASTATNAEASQIIGTINSVIQSINSNASTETKAPVAISAIEAAAIMDELTKTDALGNLAKTSASRSDAAITTSTTTATITNLLTDDAAVTKTCMYADKLAWTIDIVQVSVQKEYRKKGVFNKLLDDLQIEMRRQGLERWRAIYIEAILEEWLVKSLLKRSNAVMMPGNPNSVYLML